jgi:hypothetical protein
MSTAELLNTLRVLRHELGCSELSLRCDCKNLETVYVLERAGVLVATDRGDTFQYLDRSGDEAYGRVEVERARLICQRQDVELDERDSELYPQVVRKLGDGEPLDLAVAVVAEVIDGLFAAASKRP